MKKKLILNLAAVAFAAFSFGFGAFNNLGLTTFAMEASDNGGNSDNNSDDENNNIFENDSPRTKKRKLNKKEKTKKIKGTIPTKVHRAFLARDNKKEELIRFLEFTSMGDSNLEYLRKLKASSLKMRIDENENEGNLSHKEADKARKIIEEIAKAEEIVNDYIRAESKDEDSKDNDDNDNNGDNEDDED